MSLAAVVPCKTLFAAQAAQAEQNFNAALLNLRGTLQKEWLRRERQLSTQGTDPRHPASYRVCGPLQIANTNQVIKHQPKLQQLSEQCLSALVDHVHYALLGTELVQNKVQALLGTEVDSQGVLTKVIPEIALHVGMSGGSDSTLVLVLACALRERYGYQVQAIHCIHGLDPDDDIWLQHNQDLCTKLGVPLHTPVLNIVYGQGLSPEDSSRQERYRALLELTDPQQAFLLLGHQADDQVENFLLALKRGSGPQGLAGMRMVTHDDRGFLVRPILDLHKVELEQILSDLGYAFVYDLSNGYLKFERNYIRLKVLPSLRQRFAGIDKAILRSQKLCAYEHELAQRYVQEHAPAFLCKVSYAPYQALDTTNLDLTDRALVTMVIRHFLATTLEAQGYGSSVDYNLIERCYELLLREHDANGCLKVANTPYVAATFLHYLCLYEPEGAASLAAYQGEHFLALGQELPIGKSVYSLEAIEPTELLANPQLQGQVFRLPKLEFAQSEQTQSEPAPSTDGVWLDFNYTQSLKLKPRLRQHSREIKKLFIENQVAPWLRKAIPLVRSCQNTKSQSGAKASVESCLALGDVLATGHSREELTSDLRGYYRLRIKRQPS